MRKDRTCSLALQVFVVTFQNPKTCQVFNIRLGWAAVSLMFCQLNSACYAGASGMQYGLDKAILQF